MFIFIAKKKCFFILKNARLLCQQQANTNANFYNLEKNMV